jgi:hypothetical protein
VRVLRRRDPEEKDGLDAERRDLTSLLAQPIDGQLVDPGHRRHRPTDVLTGDDEERVDEVARLEAGFANEVAQCLRPPQAARPLRSGPDPERLERIRVERRHALSPNWSTRA